MNCQMEMDNYLDQLKDGFLNKDRNNLLESFREFAELNKPLVCATLSKVNPNESDIFWNFIESVCDNIDEWNELILSEFTRLISAAEKLKDPSRIINSLEAFHLIVDSGNTTLMKNIHKVVKMFLSTPNNYLKRFLVWILAYCIYDLDQSEIELIRNLRFDDDVIVRYYAVVSYNSYRDLPREKGLSEIDKLIIDVSDVYAIEQVV